MCVCERVNIPAQVWEIKGQNASLFPSCGTREVNSAHKAWQQELFLTSCQPLASQVYKLWLRCVRSVVNLVSIIQVYIVHLFLKMLGYVKQICHPEYI